MTSTVLVRGVLGRAVALPVLLVLLAVTGVMGARLAGPCELDPGCFAVAGARFTDPAESGLPVLAGPGADGYDGQFFWRLARSPDELGAAPVHGVTLDTTIRVGRPGYPAVVWAASGGGREGVVDWALIAVNLVATGLLSWLLAVTARRHGVLPWVGALAALWPGLLFAVGRDLSEPGSALLVVAGLVAASRGRPGVAGLAWAGAVLWREQAVLVPFAYGCCWLVTLLRGSRAARSPGPVLAWLAPLAAFLTWQAVAAGAVGEVPLLASGEQNLVPPLTALVPEAVGWLRLEDGVVGLVWTLQLGTAVALVTAALVVGYRTRRWEAVAVAVGALAVLSASRNVWVGPAHLRYATDVVVTAWFVLLSTGPVVRGRQDAPAGPAPRVLASLPTVRVVLVGAQLAAAATACVYLLRTP